MSYATTDELAAELRIRETTGNETKLQACLDAAAVEIDHEIDAVPEVTPLYSDAELALLNRVNLARAVEWFKSNDAAFGVIGSDQTGALTTPRDVFNRHAFELTPLKQQWGIA